MATTYNFTDGSITGQPVVNDTLPNTTGPFVRSNVVDFANQNLDASATDVAQVINVPADTWVERILVRVITAETANASFEIGSGLDVDQWATAFALGSTGNNTADIIDAPEYFAAADTIDLTCTGSVDIDAAKLEIVAVMIPGNKADTDGLSQQST
jgi:hypothetical protein